VDAGQSKNHRSGKRCGEIWLEIVLNDRLPFSNSLPSFSAITTFMKATSLLALFLSITPLVAQTKTEPSEGAEAPKKELLPNQQAFLNLSEEGRKEFIKHIGEASRLFQQKRVFETLEELDKAAKIFPDSPEIKNLRGSCYVEIRAFDKALVEFNSALELSKDNLSVQFNIAEVLFVTKEWQKSHDLFSQILGNIPPEQIQLSRVVEFKILLCKKKLGQKEEAIILAEKYDFLDDSPFYYYAKAALAYDENDLTKAEEWQAIAGRIFRDPAVISPWQDTLVEYGYIKSFYGEEEAAAE
jgi:tetratricopeptide (TPR) repeat protein